MNGIYDAGGKYEYFTLEQKANAKFVGKTIQGDIEVWYCPQTDADVKKSLEETGSVSPYVLLDHDSNVLRWITEDEFGQYIAADYDDFRVVTITDKKFIEKIVSECTNEDWENMIEELKANEATVDVNVNEDIPLHREYGVHTKMIHLLQSPLWVATELVTGDDDRGRPGVTGNLRKYNKKSYDKENRVLHLELATEPRTAQVKIDLHTGHHNFIKGIECAPIDSEVVKLELPIDNITVFRSELPEMAALVYGRLCRGLAIIPASGYGALTVSRKVRASSPEFYYLDGDRGIPSVPEEEFWKPEYKNFIL